MVTAETNGRVLDVVSVEQTDTLDNATTFGRNLGGSATNLATCTSRLDGTSAFTAATGVEASAGFLKGLLSRNGRYRRAETPAEPRA
jgi:sugar/nucleoside kinase (ribokinase family)